MFIFKIIRILTANSHNTLNWLIALDQLIVNSYFNVFD